jgi:hypothetical protein
MAHAEGADTLQCTDWSALLHADEVDGRRVEDLEAMSEERIVGAIQQMTSGGMEGIDETWVAFLKRHMQVSAFVAEGTRRALRRAEALCAEPAPGRCLAVQTMMYERQAQSVVLYAMDLARQLGDIPIDDARTLWENEPEWAPTRELLATLARSEDWAEIVIGINLCFEPIVGQFVRREFGSNAARAANDTVTPVVSEAGQVEWDWVRRWTLALLACLLEDATHGVRNRELVDQWVTTYTPPALNAAAVLTELGSATDWVGALESGLKAVTADQDALLTEAGLAPALTTRSEPTR